MSFVGLLNKTCTFQLNTPTQDAGQQLVDSWANVGALTNLKCRLDAISGGLVSTPTKVYESATHTLFIRKKTTTINKKNHRCVIEGNNYEILAVQEIYASKLISHLELVLELAE